jgi:hypothetical protein
LDATARIGAREIPAPRTRDPKPPGRLRCSGTSSSAGSCSSPAQRLASTSSPGGGRSDGSWREPPVQFRW